MHLIKTVGGDITKPLGVQAIVNAANNSLLGGCKTGQAKITKVYNLPCDISLLLRHRRNIWRNKGR